MIFPATNGVERGSPVAAAADAGDINGALARGVLHFEPQSRDECDVSEF
jgi:hypothetical protein